MLAAVVNVATVVDRLVVIVPVIFICPLIVVKPVLSVVITAPSPPAPIPNKLGCVFPRLYTIAQTSSLAKTERSLFL